MIDIDPGKVRDARLAAGFKKKTPAARAARVNWKTINEYESATPPAVPRMPTLEKLAAAYKCKIRDFARNPEAVDRLIEALAPQQAPA